MSSSSTATAATMLAELMNNTLRASRRQGDRRRLQLAKGRDSATEQITDNPNDFCLNHSVNRAQQKSSCACHSGANS